jgi:molybdate transport system substrate-binding protein
MLWRHYAVCLLVMVTLGGCSSTSAATGVTVFAAASLTKAFGTAGEKLAPLKVHYSFAGSQALVAQIDQGAPADVVATADEASMATLVTTGLVDAPVVFATNRIVIAVAKGNPRQISSLADLATPGVSVVLADPSVPAGKYAKQALDAAQVQVAPKSLELDVKATIGRVETGEADAAIVYATDVKASPKTEAVSFPEADAILATYPIAVVKATKNRAGAEAFVAASRTGVVHDALVEAGFTTP